MKTKICIDKHNQITLDEITKIDDEIANKLKRLQKGEYQYKTC